MSDPDAAAAEVMAAIRSHAQATGRIERFLDHEAIHRPGRGLSASQWVQRIDPLPRDSGLAVSTVRMLIMVRFYGSVDAEPRDAIDPEMSAATWALMRALTADFRLAGVQGFNAELDLMGRHGVTLFAQAGYLDWVDGGTSRIYDITTPVVVYDAWTQGQEA